MNNMHLSNVKISNIRRRCGWVQGRISAEQTVGILSSTCKDDPIEDLPAAGALPRVELPDQITVFLSKQITLAFWAFHGYFLLRKSLKDMRGRSVFT